MKNHSITLCIYLMLIILPGSNFLSAGIIQDQDKVTAEELQNHINILASDRLEGRRSGSEGFDIAASYCVTQLIEAGLQPIIRGEDGTKTFFQRITFREAHFAEGNYLTLMTGGKSIRLDQEKDYFVIRPGQSALDTSLGEFVYLNYGISEPEAGLDDFASVDVKGKIAIIKSGLPEDNPDYRFSEFQKNLYRGMGGLSVKAENLINMGARGIVVISSPLPDAAWEFTRSRILWNTVDFVNQGVRGNWVMTTKIPVYLARNDLLSKLEMLLPGFDPDSACAPQTSDSYFKMGVEFIRKNTANVVAGIEGTDPELRYEYITMGAHLDHLGIINGEICNGANDNAAGCASVLEIAESLAADPPKRSVLVVLYSLEETGVMGSGYFVHQPPVPVESMLANVNFEMMGSLDLGNLENCYVATLSPAFSGSMNRILQETNKQTFDLPMNPLDSQWAGSDHVQYYMRGIPVIGIGSVGEFPDYHMPTDDADKLHYLGMEVMARLGLDLIRNLANRSERFNTDGFIDFQDILADTTK